MVRQEWISFLDVNFRIKRAYGVSKKSCQLPNNGLIASRGRGATGGRYVRSLCAEGDARGKSGR